MKKGLVQRNLLFLSLAILVLIFIVVCSMNSVSAADTTPTSGVVVSSGTDFMGLFSFNFTEKLNLWKAGPEADTATASNLMKYYILFMIIILIYSVFSYLRFPDNAGLRIALAVITGFMATFFISTKELLTLAQSYGALGLAITTFFPILILGGLTIVTATKLNPVGIFFSKILWLGYAIFLFFRTGLIWLASRTLSVVPVAGQPGNYTLSGTMSPLIASFFGTTRTMVDGSLQTVLSPAGEANLARQLASYDPSMLFILGIIALAVLYFMVIKSDWLYEYIDKMKRDSEVSAAKSTIKRSKDYDKLRADEMQDIGSNKT